MIFMKFPFMIKKAYVQTVRMKQAKYVRGVENVTLVIVNPQKGIIDLDIAYNVHVELRSKERIMFIFQSRFIKICKFYINFYEEIDQFT